MARSATGLPSSRLTVPDAAAEAVAGIVQRPGRAVLTMLGTVLGVGAFVAVLGLTATGAGQISRQFTVLEDTTVTVEDNGPANNVAAPGTNPPIGFPADADAVADHIKGVVAAGVWWPVSLPEGTSFTGSLALSAAASQTISLLAASPGAVRAMGLKLVAGSPLSAYENDTKQHVAVIDTTTAASLGISAARLASHPAVFVDGVAYTVVGVYSSARRVAAQESAMLIPEQTALADYGNPEPGISRRAAATFAMLRDAARFFSAAGDDGGPGGPGCRMGGDPLDCLDQRPAQHPRSLPGDMPARDLGVGLAVPRGQAGPRAQLARVPEPGDVADLGDDDGGEHRADAGQLLDHLAAAVGGQQVRDHLAQHGDLGGELAGQLPQRRHLPGIRLRQAEGVQPRRPGHPEDIRAGHRDAELGQHRVHLIFAAGPQVHELLPVARQLPELPHLSRGDPGLGQPAHPQQVSQIRCVTLIVFDPAVGERLHAQRMRQVHLGARRGQGVRRPVPPVRGLQDHLRGLTGPGDLRPQLRRAVGDPRRAQPPAILGHPHQHAAPAVQIHAHDLPAVIRCLHWGPPFFLVETDALQLPASAREREAPLLHRINLNWAPLQGYY
jgi:hypothetical protein